MAPLARFNCARRPRAGIAGVGSQYSSETHSGSCRHRRCCAPRPRLAQSRWSSGSRFVGGLKSLSRRLEFTSEWRLSVSGRIGRSRVPHRSLLGLFSWATLAAKLLQQECPSSLRTASWYNKTEPTFIDAIALVRRHLWLGTETLSTSESATDVEKIPLPLFDRLVESLAYAA